jgi:YidC/Oxa1 family membrane protein insertase
LIPIAVTVVANILQPLIDVANAVLEAFHEWGLSWGGAIIALTIATRTLLIPLTYKQLKGMRALQAFQPQIKELQEKYKNDRQRLSQEMMKFYQENKINPLASCIPLIAQMPIFITLFYTLRGPLREDMCGQTALPCGEVVNPATGQLGGFGESFFFIPDLTAQAVGGVLIALIILYVGTQLVSGLIMATTADRNQRLLMMALPFIFIPFILNFPAGLILYWITTNFWTIGQQAVVNKVIPPPAKLDPQVAAAVKAPPPPPPRKKKRRR